VKPFLFLSAAFIFLASCHSPGRPTMQLADSLVTTEQQNGNLPALNGVPVENIIRFASSNFHLVGNNPCMYYDAGSDEYVISGKKLFQRIKASERKEAMHAFHEFLRDRTYSPDGDSARQEYQKVMINGKEMYMAQMDDLLPQIKPEERALFNEQQYNVLEHTAGSDIYRYLATERSTPVVYASSSGLSLEGKNMNNTIPMQNAKEAITIFCNYVDQLRK
jgi:hypothetical protein